MLEHFEWNWLGKLWIGVGDIEALLLGIAAIWIALILLSGDKSERVLVTWIVFAVIMLSIGVGMASLLLGAVTWAYWGPGQAVRLTLPALIVPGMAYLFIRLAGR